MEHGNFTENMRRLQNNKVKITDIKVIDTHTRQYTFSMPTGLSWTPGSNAHFGFLDFISDNHLDKSLVRHMSIASSPKDNKIVINCRVPGSKSKYKQLLDKSKIGDEMYLFKVNNHMPLVNENKNVVLLSMGIGITSFKSYFDAYIEGNTSILSITSICVDGKETNLFENDYNHEGISLEYLSSRDSFYKRLKKTINNDYAYYIVGSDRFLLDTITILLQDGISKENIHIDKKEIKLSAFGLGK
jgi:ferredoxin--NADP+ reductase